MADARAVWIHGVGLTPDVIVEAPAEPVAGEDPVLDRGVEVVLDALAVSSRTPSRQPTTNPSPTLAPVPTA